MIYQQYWNLRNTPFANHHDSRQFVATQTHQAALLKLKYVIENRHGAGLLSGAIGTGKSALIRQLENELGADHGPIVHVLYPQMPPSDLLAFLAHELGTPESLVPEERRGLDRVVRRLGRQLTFHNEQGRHPVIVIDDAHLVRDSGVFEALYQLLNFQQMPNQNFTLLLSGDLSLIAQVRRIGQLDERIACVSILAPLSIDETAHYVGEQLRSAGSDRDVFTDDAIQALHRHSEGLPRRINRLCDMALLVGFADKLTTIDASDIAAVAEELSLPRAA